jgi:hypothetical protein
VPPFDDELRECLEVVVGERPPDSERFVKHWLAGRNLGLVPIADAAGFDWPGHWIARVQGGSEDHAVVMFGSPSGPVHDPGGAFAAGGAIVEGWLVAPLDLHRQAVTPGEGVVAAILVADDAERPMRQIETAQAVPGRGLEGDRYFEGRGTFAGPGLGYEVTLVEAEELEALGFSREQARRNVVTRGIRLNGLVGRRFTIGEVECIGRRLAEPCAHLERLSGPGLLRPFVHRAGLRADILAGGTIGLGDPVSVR